MPGNPLLATPAAHGEVTCKGVAIARFFVSVQGSKRGLLVQGVQHVNHLAHGHVQPPAHSLQLGVKLLHAFEDELVMLRSHVGLRPQAGFDHVQAQHGA